nr:uncharacterized protein LOC127309613 [Lolium perenne]
MACSASSQTGSVGHGGNGGPGGNGDNPLPLIPCPICGSRLSMAVARKGTRPGIRYYKCQFFSSGQCSFFEWREGYTQLVGGNQVQAQPAPPQAAAHADPMQLSRLNLLVSATNTIAILLVLAVVIVHFMWASSY